MSNPASMQKFQTRTRYNYKVDRTKDQVNIMKFLIQREIRPPTIEYQYGEFLSTKKKCYLTFERLLDRTTE